LFGLKNIVAIHLETWPFFAQLLLMFVVRDFIQWWGHRTLHRFPALWEFHKVHHSVEQMGFAAHLRYHWFENIFYRTFEYIPLAMIGFGIHDFFFVHIFALAWGHYNHANIPSNPKITGSIVAALLGAGVASMFPGLGWGATTGLIALGTVIGYGWLSKYMLYLFNSPDMHIWHHAYDIPPDRQTGINFGITLACWDYLFGTAYMPFPGKDIRLGFPGIEKFPKSFLGQNLHGFQNAQHQKPKDMEPARGTSA
jgi:sterol desaturase/sphingolipid hydroxylase (fatty acid hydroxylase superfamily)